MIAGIWVQFAGLCRHYLLGSYLVLPHFQHSEMPGHFASSTGNGTGRNGRCQAQRIGLSGVCMEGGVTRFAGQQDPGQ